MADIDRLSDLEIDVEDMLTVREGDDARHVPLCGGLADTYRAELEDFLVAAGGGPAPRTTLADGLAAVRLADAVRRSAADGARVAFVPQSPDTAARTRHATSWID